MDYKKIPDDLTIERTVSALKARNFDVVLVDNGEKALAEVVRTIPPKSKVLNGSSTTLAEIGFMETLNKGTNQWNNLHEEVLKEPDMIKRSDLRRRLTAEADYFLASANAVTKDGRLVAVDASGSRVGAIPFVAKKVLLVIGVNKIVENLDEAFKRVKEYIVPLEDQRMMKMYNAHTSPRKWIIIDGERDPQRIKLILVKEPLGF